MLQRSIERTIREGRNRPLLFFLYLLSLLFGAASTLRAIAYDRKWLPSFSAALPVVSVGNIVAGGTGKTPFALFLAQAVADIGKPGILYRGYRALAERAASPVLLSKGAGPLVSASVGGDEAYLLAYRLPQAVVVSGKNRVRGADLATRYGADILLMDDGLQHRRLRRDVDIVVVDGRNPFGGGFYLPRGSLRESARSLRRANWIVVNHYARLSAEDRSALMALNPNAPLIGIESQPAGVFDPQGRLSGGRLDGMRVGAFCGIATPEAFYETVRSLGGQVVLTHTLTDHEPMSAYELMRFGSSCANLGAACLVCTEKDLVKLTPCANSPLPVYGVRLAVRVTAGEENWRALQAKLLALMQCNQRERENHE